MAIDIGFPPEAGDGENGTGTTVINLYNPANATGTLNTFQVYPNNDGVSGLKIGTFSGTQGSCASRDYESVGNAAGAAVRTFSDINCDVESGDYIGWYSSGGGIKYKKATATRWYKAGVDTFGTTTSYNDIGSYVDMLYGESSETAVGQPYMKRLGGVQYAALNRGVF